MSRDMLIEDVPSVSRRQGDQVLGGQNNSALVLGRDRQGSVDSGYGDRKGAGALHAVVGRRSGDPSVPDDAASLYLSAMSDPDEQSAISAGTPVRGKPTAVLRADCIRVSGRYDIKVSVGSAYLTMTADGKIVLDGQISLGEGAADRVLKADAFSEFWSTLSIPTPSGPSGPPPPLPPSVFSSRPVLVK